MKPESHQPDSPGEELRLPPELLAALAKQQAAPVTVPPELDAAILRQAAARLSACRRSQRTPVVSWFLWPVAAAACLALVITLGRPDSGADAGPTLVDTRAEDVAAILLREFSALHPNQLRAIIRDDQGIQVELADTPSLRSGQPVVLRVCQPEQCKEIITFSGTAINVAGHSVTVRTDDAGRVILDGERFLWSSDRKENPAPGISIESRRL